MSQAEIKKQKQREATARWRAAHPERNRLSQEKQDAKPDRKEKQAARAKAKRNTSEGKEYAAEYRKRPEVKERDKIFSTSDRRREWSRQWRKSAERRALSAEYMRNVRKTPRGMINNRMSVSIRRMISESKASRRWEDIAGYSLNELMIHLERQFHDGMTWENANEWHVDHIIPLSSFSFDSYECDEFKSAWAITNLRPLWAKDNLEKSDKIEVLL